MIRATLLPFFEFGQRVDRIYRYCIATLSTLIATYRHFIATHTLAIVKSYRIFCHFHDSCYLCQRIKTKRIMAKPIKETPVLTGDDATRFAQSAHEVVPASQKEKDDAKKAYSFFASIANFAL